MRQREHGHRSDGNADDDTQAFQPGAAEERLLQQVYFQGDIRSGDDVYGRATLFESDTVRLSNDTLM
jgi:hypothetical protein